jgi:hypothetical protein
MNDPVNEKNSVIVRLTPCQYPKTIEDHYLSKYILFLHGLMISRRSNIELPAMKNMFSRVQFVMNLSPPSE